VLLTVAQIVGRVLSGSLALIAEALHNFSDAGSLGIALAARRIARRPADKRRTFGYQRAETIGSLINLTTLILIGLYLISEAVVRRWSPRPIEGWIVIAVAAAALVIDSATVVLTWAMSKGSLNLRAAFVHNLADAMGSLAVIVAGTLILLFDLRIADLVATLGIAAYVIYQGVAMMRQSVHILMESVPDDVSYDELLEALAGVPGVCDAHHVHIWHLDEHRHALEAHIVFEPGDVAAMESLKREIKRRLAERFDITHSTLEFETARVESGARCFRHT